MIKTLQLFCFVCISISYAFSQSDSLLLKKHVFVLASDSLNGRGFGSTDGEKAARYIAGKFAEYGLQSYSGSYIHTFSHRMRSARVNGQNVIGVIEGSDAVLKNEYIVLGAHYDHLGYDEENDSIIIYNGADDNASGTSMLLELARLLNQQKGKLKRSVIFIAFDGEESGLIGSYFLVNNHILPTNLKVMFSIDMVGMLSTYKGIDLKGSATFASGDAFFQALAEKHQLSIKKSGKKVENRTDTKPFANYSIPAIAITTGTKSPYHKPEDDAQLLDYNGMAQITDFLYDVTCQLADNMTIEPDMPLAGEKDKHPPIFTHTALLNVGSGKYYFIGEYFTSKPILAAELGYQGRLRLSKKLALQSGLLAQLSGGHDSIGRDYYTALNIPLQLNFTVGGSDAAQSRFCIFGGIYGTYLLSGNSKFDVEVNSADKNLSYTVGLTAGFTFEFDPVIIGLNLEYGGSPMVNENLMGNFRSRNAYFTMGYRF